MLILQFCDDFIQPVSGYNNNNKTLIHIILLKTAKHLCSSTDFNSREYISELLHVFICQLQSQFPSDLIGMVLTRFAAVLLMQPIKLRLYIINSLKLGACL